MTRKKTEVYILTVFLLLVAVYFGTREPWEKPAFSFVAVTEAGAETLQPWHDGNGNGYVFLPSYVTLDQLQIRTTRPVFFGETKMTYGKSCEPFRLDTPYSLTGMDEFENITFIRSQNLPTIYIDTVSGNMNAIHESKENEESGSFRLYNEQGILENRGNLESIKARGNASFYKSKKPYNLKFTSKQNLLGMGGAKKWILLANAYDSSHLKNKVVYDFAAEAGLPYSPESHWVDLYLNGNYAGLYLLCERNEVAPQRVSLPDGEGFLVSKEQAYNVGKNGNPYFSSNAGVNLRVHFNSLENGQMEQIVQSAENAILDGVDPVTGKHWRDLIDLDSWARKYLVEEIFGGIDAGVASQFFFYQSVDEKIYAGPVWDYDAAMSTIIGLEDGMPVIHLVPEMFFAHRNLQTPWFCSLYRQHEFYDEVVRLYQQEFSRLLENYTMDRIPQYAEQIRQAAWVNQVRWNVRDSQTSTDEVRNYLTERMKFLGKAWTENAEYVEVHVNYTYDTLEGQYFSFDYAVPIGQCLPQLLHADGFTWYIAGTDIPFVNNQPIFEETSIQLRRD